jgi:L,D-transpeptidase ErfK/SrfK
MSNRLVCTALVWILVPYGALYARQMPAQRIVGDVTRYRVEPGETLFSIGARHGVDWTVLARENGLNSPGALAIGQTLTIDNRHIVPSTPLESGIVINIPQRMLFLFAGGAALSAYPVGLGRPDWQTPRGLFQIASRDENPTWIVPPEIQEEMRQSGQPVVRQMAPGSRNPLGAYRLRFNDPGYSIHGTNEPSSIYGFPSHGCIRLHPEDIAGLFPLVALGTEVRIVYEPVLAAKLPDGAVFLEVHHDIYGIAGNLREYADRLNRDENLAIDRAALERTVVEVAGVARLVSEVEPPAAAPGNVEPEASPGVPSIANAQAYLADPIPRACHLP